MKDPQDHLAKGAVQREAEPPEPVEIEFLGVTLTLPPSAEDWPIDAMEAIEQGQGVKWARLLFSDEAWRRVKAAIRKSTGRTPAMRDLEPLMEQVASLYGFDDLGN